jgi:hypothetical protein
MLPNYLPGAFVDGFAGVFRRSHARLFSASNALRFSANGAPAVLPEHASELAKRTIISLTRDRRCARILSFANFRLIFIGHPSIDC